MNIKIAVLAVGLTLSAAARPQSPALSLPDFQPLASKAHECVDVTLGPWLLHSMGLFLDDKDPEDAAAKKLLSGIQSIRVRSYQFDSDSAYSRADVEAVRRQLNAPGWTPLMNVHNRDRGEDVDMYMLVQNEQTRGFALVASEPKEFTIVNVVGSIAVSDLPKLQKQLRLNKLMAGTEALAWPAAAQL